MRRPVLCFILCGGQWLALLIFSSHLTVCLSLGCLSSKQLPPGSLKPLRGNTSWVSCHHHPQYLSNLQRNEPRPTLTPSGHLQPYPVGLDLPSPEDCSIQEVTYPCQFPFPRLPWPHPAPGFPAPGCLWCSANLSLDLLSVQTKCFNVELRQELNPRCSQG